MNTMSIVLTVKIADMHSIILKLNLYVETNNGKIVWSPLCDEASWAAVADLDFIRFN